MQFGLVAVGVFALVAIDLYAGNKDRDVDAPIAGERQNDNMSSNLERRAAEGELEMYNNNMLDASLAVHGEELPAAAYNTFLPGQDEEPKPRSIARRGEDLDSAVNDQQVQPGAMDRYEVKPDAPKPAYMLSPPKKQSPPKPAQHVQPVPPPIVSQQQSQQPRPQPPRPAQPKSAQPKPKAQPRPIKPNFLEQAAKANEAASTEATTKIDYNPSANAVGLRGGADAGRNQAQNAAYHPHLDQNQGKISEMEVVEGEVQRRKARATWLTGGLFGGLFVVYKAASLGYLLF